MKRNIGIIGIIIAIFSISAYTYRNLNANKNYGINARNPQKTVFYDKYLFNTLDNSIYYSLDSKFNISKDKLSKPTAILDMYSKLAGEKFEHISSTSIAKLNADMQPIITENAENNILSDSQMKVLKSLDYQDNLLLKMIIKKENPKTGKMMSRLLLFHLKVVPEDVAEYSLGEKAFIDFIRENTETETLNISKKEIGFGSISFVVLGNGEVSDINVNNKSKLKKLDDKLIKLLNNLPGKWKPARNAQGESIAQELIFSFGNQGC